MQTLAKNPNGADFRNIRRDVKKWAQKNNGESVIPKNKQISLREPFPRYQEEKKRPDGAIIRPIIVPATCGTAYRVEICLLTHSFS